jgi:hypothetical protein
MLLEQRSDGCREVGTALHASPDGQESRLPITFGARIATSGVRQPALGQVGGQSPGWDMSKGWWGGFFARQQAEASNPHSVDAVNRSSSTGAPLGVMGKVGSDTAETLSNGVEGGDTAYEERGWESLASGAPPSQIKAAGLLNCEPLTGPLSPIGTQYPFACAFLSRCEAERMTHKEAMVLVKQAMDLDPLIKEEFVKLAEFVKKAGPPIRVPHVVPHVVPPVHVPTVPPRTSGASSMMQSILGGGPSSAPHPSMPGGGVAPHAPVVGLPIAEHAPPLPTAQVAPSGPPTPPSGNLRNPTSVLPPAYPEVGPARPMLEVRSPAAPPAATYPNNFIPAEPPVAPPAQGLASTQTSTTTGAGPPLPTAAIAPPRPTPAMTLEQRRAAIQELSPQGRTAPREGYTRPAIEAHPETSTPGVQAALDELHPPPSATQPVGASPLELGRVGQTPPASGAAGAATPPTGAATPPRSPWDLLGRSGDALAKVTPFESALGRITPGTGTANAWGRTAGRGLDTVFNTVSGKGAFQNLLRRDLGPMMGYGTAAAAIPIAGAIGRGEQPDVNMMNAASLFGLQLPASAITGAGSMMGHEPNMTESERRYADPFTSTMANTRDLWDAGRGAYDAVRSPFVRARAEGGVQDAAGQVNRGLHDLPIVSHALNTTDSLIGSVLPGRGIPNPTAAELAERRNSRLTDLRGLAKSIASNPLQPDREINRANNWLSSPTGLSAPASAPPAQQASMTPPESRVAATFPPITPTELRPDSPGAQGAPACRPRCLLRRPQPLLFDRQPQLFLRSIRPGQPLD